MLQITIIAVGRAKDSAERDLFNKYRERFDKVGSGQGLASLSLIEVEEKRSIQGDERKKREAELILNALPEGAVLVLLDERGKALSSKEICQLIETNRDQGVRDLVFVIGGADGVTIELRNLATKLLSFGPATWPHMLARTMLGEQIYRAVCILSGHPYHKV